MSFKLVYLILRCNSEIQDSIYFNRDQKNYLPVNGESTHGEDKVEIS